MSNIDDAASVLAHFNRLVAQGVVFYLDNQRRILHEDKGLNFEFRITAALTNKPSGTSLTPTTLPSAGVGDVYQPGSDISINNFAIGPVGDSHVLAFNKFCVVRPHMLLVTADGFRRQYEALDLHDLAAARHVMGSSFQGGGGGREYMMLYNCGVDAGCSRLHKHMQILPKPGNSIGGYRLWLDDTEDMVGAMIPFKHFLARFKDLPDANGLLRVYLSLLGNAQAALRDQGENKPGHAVAHNVVLTRRWMVVIPRRRAGVDGADANAAGMLGMVWLSDEDRLKKWLEVGPADVLTQCGVPDTR
ncbi:hypothetical protein CONLIGDRAFT_669221 [Coniochaeta ligniaria NRRL 30616]|uniref:Uncharacterized protein n=1 Tax=Coniochaeta ligniaria NRRL 30616 TaxID=1408157 RepID=A0A1J7JNK6_9PEZI|nr:hypothetical protein CONLIGDRAFT_669221 [Coniochaeta ligniaria NRRL 30616]